MTDQERRDAAAAQRLRTSWRADLSTLLLWGVPIPLLFGCFATVILSLNLRMGFWGAVAVGVVVWLSLIMVVVRLVRGPLWTARRAAVGDDDDGLGGNVQIVEHEIECESVWWLDGGWAESDLWMNALIAVDADRFVYLSDQGLLWTVGDDEDALQQLPKRLRVTEWPDGSLSIDGVGTDRLPVTELGLRIEELGIDDKVRVRVIERASLSPRVLSKLGIV